MASTLTKAEKAQSQEYKMPVAHVGQIVLWYQDGDVKSKPRPLTVIEIGPRTINGVPIGSHEPRVGIRHMSDVQAKDFEMSESGTWDFTQETKDIWELISNMEAKIARKE